MNENKGENVMKVVLITCKRSAPCLCEVNSRREQRLGI